MSLILEEGFVSIIIRNGFGKNVKQKLFAISAVNLDRDTLTNLLTDLISAEVAGGPNRNVLCVIARPKLKVCASFITEIGSRCHVLAVANSSGRAEEITGLHCVGIADFQNEYAEFVASRTRLAVCAIITITSLSVAR